MRSSDFKNRVGTAVSPRMKNTASRLIRHFGGKTPGRMRGRFDGDGGGAASGRAPEKGRKLSESAQDGPAYTNSHMASILWFGCAGKPFSHQKSLSRI